MQGTRHAWWYESSFAFLSAGHSSRVGGTKMNWMTRASILHAVRVTIVSMWSKRFATLTQNSVTFCQVVFARHPKHHLGWSCKLFVGFVFERLFVSVHLLFFFRSFFQCSMFVRWYVFVVSFCTFDFGGSGACADEQTEQHFDTCVVERFDLALPTHTDVCLCSIAYQTFTIADSIIQNGEAYGGLGTCRSRKTGHAKLQHLSSKVWVFSKLWCLTGWQATFVLRHTLSGRICATSTNTTSRCGCTPIPSCVFVPVPVGRINCLLGLYSMWVSFLSLFRSGLVLVHSVEPLDAASF